MAHLSAHVKSYPGTGGRVKPSWLSFSRSSHTMNRFFRAKSMQSFALALLFCLAFTNAAAASCRDLDLTQRGSVAYAAEADAVIQYFGHNFFQITTAKGTKIITDPLAPGMYPTPNVSPHVVTVGREHPNHN